MHLNLSGVIAFVVRLNICHYCYLHILVYTLHCHYPVCMFVPNLLLASRLLTHNFNKQELK